MYYRASWWGFRVPCATNPTGYIGGGVSLISFKMIYTIKRNKQKLITAG
tara:strand:- start:1815 stop:1961 length:147 start_codon:yes stop_codon:yes gene_type:complete